MGKNRREQFAISNCDVKERFSWVARVGLSKTKIFGTKKTLCVSFNRNATNIEDFGYQRQRFEEFVQSFYEVKRGRNQVVVMWQETEAIVAVF